VPTARPCAMADLKDIVAVNVRRLRNARGWTQEELADRVGLSTRYVGRVERAQASMSITVLGRLADALKVEATDLVKRTRVTSK
jgi:transcriptional regulator with XRE-family HTH domain